jgi:type IX secretion system substrate protein
MKKLLAVISSLNYIFLNYLSAQPLPPVAQALYNEAYQQDSFKVQFALNHGAQILATPDGNSFYVKWFPVGSIPSATPVIVTLHGSHGYAFFEFYNWFLQAQQHQCGIIALQWYRGNAAVPPYDYFDDDTLYNYIDSALAGISYPAGKAFLHGFSRGSARSYAIIFKDSHGGQNYFCTALSNAGGADPGYPLYAQINAGIYGSNVLSGKHWNLFCGGLDSNAAQSGCIGMTNTQTWLQGQGATIDIFIQDSTLGHDGFHLVPAYMDSVLDNYLLCYNGALSIDETVSAKEIKIYPNPSSGVVNIVLPGNEKYELIIYNSSGEKIYDAPSVSSGELNPANYMLQTSNFPEGIYYLVITGEKRFFTSKIILLKTILLD